MDQWFSLTQAENTPQRLSRIGLAIFHLREFTGPNFSPSKSSEEKVPELNRCIKLLKGISIDEGEIDGNLDYLLGWAYFSRYHYTNKESRQDLETSILYNSRYFRSLKPPLMERIKIGPIIAECLACLGRYKESVDILSDVIEMFPMLNLRALSYLDQQYIIRNTTGIASMAASLALEAKLTPYSAPRLLELGRSVIASLSMDMRGDITKIFDPNQESRFFRAQEALEKRQGANKSALDDYVSRWVMDSRSRYEGEPKFEIS